MHRGIAAAVTGGVLAAALPVVAVTSAPAAGTDTAALKLTSDAAADAASRVASVVPVGPVADPGPPEFSVSGLLKSAGLADVARRAAEEEAAREGSADCDTDLGALGRVKPWVRDAARFLACLYGEPDLISVAGRGRHSDHPSGLAIDFMVRGERGDRLAACALANRAALGISYVIWEQRINYGDGWERMQDRGSATENHVDHVHVSFERRPGTDDPVAARCS
ncbi:MAG: hypothetical protein QOF00_1614 [Pseudonocardiales bacterium]|nr:hypothetical protein [Pseudonocardiales bacterium]